MKKKEYSKYIGLGLIFGVAIGFSLGLIISTPDNAPLFGGIGAGIGIVLCAIIGHFKIK
jgi:hypothetical protein